MDDNARLVTELLGLVNVIFDPLNITLYIDDLSGVSDAFQIVQPFPGKKTKGVIVKENVDFVHQLVQSTLHMDVVVFLTGLDLCHDEGNFNLAGRI